MTKRLILIRHAKSSWNDPFADDHARILNKRGRASAQAVGKWLAANCYVPQRILCSDASRTQETAELILPALSPAPELRLTGRLYHAAPDTIIDLIKREVADTVAVIAHNPSIGMLANALVTVPPDHHRFGDYPTCATTVIDFEIDCWPNIERRGGSCRDFIVPRDLIGTSAQDID
ncbi:MAG: histidine phosphatase family protein [Pseudomonadota bacterium]